MKMLLRRRARATRRSKSSSHFLSVWSYCLLHERFRPTRAIASGRVFRFLLSVLSDPRLQRNGKRLPFRAFYNLSHSPRDSSDWSYTLFIRDLKSLVNASPFGYPDPRAFAWIHSRWRESLSLEDWLLANSGRLSRASASLFGASSCAAPDPGEKLKASPSDYKY